jgi:hypothetical protein
MNGYEYLVARNRLMIELEGELRKLSSLGPAEREQETRRLRAEFDQKLAALYAQVAAEYPGERRKKARALSDPR